MLSHLKISTLFSPTFKVEGKEVPLLFHFMQNLTGNENHPQYLLVFLDATASLQIAHVIQ